MISFDKNQGQHEKNTKGTNEFEHVSSIDETNTASKTASGMPGGEKHKPIQRIKKNSDVEGSTTTESNNGSDETAYTEPSNANKSKLLLLLLFVVIIALVACSIYFAFFVESNKSDPETPTLTDDIATGAVYDTGGNLIYDENNSVVDPDAFNPGQQEFTGNIGGMAPEEVYSVTDFLKDVNGIDVSAVYNVDNIEYVYDYVNYSLRRGIIGDGMEMYWLDIDYKGKRYREQIPFYYAKDLDNNGIIRMHIEVLNLEGGGKIISYMEVAPNDQ